MSQLTPCAGRCSTVFGDKVCTGCRRFIHEVDHWNTMTKDEQSAVWRRLDSQIDSILLPMLPNHNLDMVTKFLNNSDLRYPDSASLGRILYIALRYVEKRPALIPNCGLGLTQENIYRVWNAFDKAAQELGKQTYNQLFNS